MLQTAWDLWLFSCLRRNFEENIFCVHILGKSYQNSWWCCSVLLCWLCGNWSCAGFGHSVALLESDTKRCKWCWEYLCFCVLYFPLRSTGAGNSDNVFSHLSVYSSSHHFCGCGLVCLGTNFFSIWWLYVEVQRDLTVFKKKKKKGTKRKVKPWHLSTSLQNSASRNSFSRLSGAWLWLSTGQCPCPSSEVVFVVHLVALLPLVMVLAELLRLHCFCTDFPFTFFIWSLQGASRAVTVSEQQVKLVCCLPLPINVCLEMTFVLLCWFWGFCKSCLLISCFR